MNKNPNSILFLYEGETEAEFYKLFFQRLPQRKIQICPGNLKGVYNLNAKVRSKVLTYLDNDKFVDCSQIHVFVAYDREGPRGTDPGLNIAELESEFIGDKNSRISSFNEIIATQDLESWLFHDLENIYKYLGVKKSKRNMKAYPNVEATNNYVLSDLFHRHKKHYQKGKKVEGFLNSLDIEKIISNIPELIEAEKLIKDLM